MGGIFGVGMAELVVIALLILIVAGPRRSALWARQLGLYIRQLRTAWQKWMRELESELGEDTIREFREVSDEIGRTAGDIRRVSSPRSYVNQAVKLAGNLEPEPSNNNEPPKYEAWVKAPTNSADTENRDQASDD